MVKTVHDITASWVEIEDERQQHNGYCNMQDIVVPPLPVQDTLPVIVSHQEEHIEIEGALDGKGPSQVCQPAQDRNKQRDEKIQRRSFEQ